MEQLKIDKRFLNQSIIVKVAVFCVSSTNRNKDRDTCHFDTWIQNCPSALKVLNPGKINGVLLNNLHYFLDTTETFLPFSIVSEQNFRRWHRLILYTNKYKCCSISYSPVDHIKRALHKLHFLSSSYGSTLSLQKRSPGNVLTSKHDACINFNLSA